MSRSEVAPEVLRQILSCCPDDGSLTWLARPASMFPGGRRTNTWNTRYAGTPALTALSGYGYRVGSVLGRRCFAHRVIWALCTGAWPVGEIDHINGNRTDNRIVNLRAVTTQENRMNARLSRANKSGTNGVGWNPKTGLWRAQIMVSKKAIHLGQFDRLEAAIAAREAANVAYGFHPNHGRSL